MPTQAELGIRTAKTLLAELTIPPGVKAPTDKALEILDVVPSDGEFFSYQKDYKKIEPTKEALLQDMLGDKKSIVAFCCASLQVDTRLAFDIDHVFPREKVTEKQKLLFNYLNDPRNDVFTKAFMGEKPKDDELKEKIGKYFKRDPKDPSKIKGTQWFFDVCYNNLSNLFHLKNYLNRGKSAATPQEWLKQNFQPILPNFMKDLDAKGGINEGIIMQQIFSTVTLDSINLGKVKDKHGKDIGSDVIVYLHEGIGVGLGHFIRHWFKANTDVIKISKEIHEINTKLTIMLTEDLGDNGEEEGLEKFLLTINEALQLAQDRSKLGRASSEDSEKAGESRKKVSYKSLLKAFNYMHSVKQIKKQILANVEAAHKDAVQNDFYDICMEHWFDLTDTGLKIATEYLTQQCELKKQSGTFFTANDVRTMIIEAGKKGDPEKRLEEERRAREAAEAKAIAAETEAAELRRQLAAVLAKQQVAASHITPEDSQKHKRPRL